MKNIRLPSSKLIRLTALVIGLAAGASLMPPRAQGAEEAAPAAKTDAADPEAKAWAELREATKPPAQPAAWKTNRPSQSEYKAFMLKNAEAAAGKLAEFLAQFPQGTHAADARKLQQKSLLTAAMLGSTERAEELAKLLAKTAADTSLPDDDRVAARLTQLGLDSRKPGGTDQAATMKAVANGLLAIQKDFPKNEQVYAAMMSLMNTDEGGVAKQLAKVIVESPDAPAKLKPKAQDVLDGKVFSAAANIGKPVDIKFTAVDGTEVDLAKLKGKVVLVDFWATWCGPCVAEIPNVVAAYEKYHAQGFEIVGISFDRAADKEKLVKFTKEKNMPWVQYFDGKFWENDFGQRFNIRSIPAMWLFDKDGNLVDTKAREDLAGKVAKLLEAK